MKKTKTEELSLLPLIEKKEKECRERIASAEKKASQRIEQAQEEAKRLIETRRTSVMAREAKRLKDAAVAMEEEMKAKRGEEAKKRAALEEELKKRIPLAAQEVLKLILPS